jgi:hypothetical protein
MKENAKHKEEDSDDGSVTGGKITNQSLSSLTSPTKKVKLEE